ncbi:hypothetical protein BH11PSE2_BH11PSE2_21780 [soil metagenome]
MLHNLMDWLQYTWGADKTEYGRSYSAALLESLNFWGLLEGAHLLMLMVFFGTILFVDLRLMGLIFKKVPISVISERVLKITIFSMVILMFTGVFLFFSKPEEYWHNIWFRTKLVLLAVAMINVVIMHFVIQKNMSEWDAAESPPAKAKMSAAISILSWVLVIGCGRLIAYNWAECGKPQPDWLNAAQQCKVSKKGIMTLEQGVAIDKAAAATAAADKAAAEKPAAMPPMPNMPATPAAPAADPWAKAQPQGK